MEDSLKKLNYFKNLLQTTWVKKTMGGVFNMRDRRARKGKVISFSLPNSLKIDGTYPSTLEVWTTNDNEYVQRVDGLICAENKTNGEDEENFRFTFFLNDNLYELLKRNGFDYNDVYQFEFILHRDSIESIDQRVVIGKYSDERSFIEVSQYWSLISGLGDSEFKKNFKLIDLSKDEKELETLANDMVEWLYNYMTVEAPKKFKEELNNAIDKVFNIIRERLRSKW